MFNPGHRASLVLLRRRAEPDVATPFTGPKMAAAEDLDELTLLNGPGYNRFVEARGELI